MMTAVFQNPVVENIRAKLENIRANGYIKRSTIDIEEFDSVIDR